jgi:hypothetical protein
MAKESASELAQRLDNDIDKFMEELAAKKTNKIGAF